MVRPTEQRILAWLSQYDDSLQNAWDVPREISLPGIADAIGVVRSALHKPLKNLQEKGLIVVKQAHVINGGTRKRNVHFITERGREMNNSEQNQTNATIIGNPPNNIELVGRSKEVEKINSIFLKEKSAWITGIAGIGKTAILRHFAEFKAQEGNKIRWYSATSTSSAKTTVETWLELTKLSSNIKDLIAIIKVEAKNDILVIDNFDQLSHRFKNEIENLIEKLIENKCQIIISSRPPLPEIKSKFIEIFGLNNASAKKLLAGFEKIEINKIVEYFDGHPLALTMANEGMSLESTQKDLNTFLEKEILAPLTKNSRAAILELAIQPEPIETKLLSHKKQLSDLDDLGLITYYGNKIQLQNFVRNLLTAQMGEIERKKLHSDFARHMANLTLNSPKFLRLFHEINSERETMSEWVERNAASICVEYPAKSSALFHEMITKNEENGELCWYAAISECELGNSKIAEKLINNAEKYGGLTSRKNESLMLNCRISRLSGDIKKAEQIFNEISFENDFEYFHYLIAEISRKIDDRLPNRLPGENSINLLNKINLKLLTTEQKRSTLIAIACIKHTFSLYNKNLSKAEEIRKEVSELTSSDSELLREMIWRNSIISGDKLEFKTDNIIRTVGSICWRLEFEEGDKLELLSQLKSIIGNYPELENRPAGRRSIALYWTWVGLIDETKRPSAWTQAIGRWISAECYKAGTELQNKLHKWLTDTGRA